MAMVVLNATAKLYAIQPVQLPPLQRSGAARFTPDRHDAPGGLLDSKRLDSHRPGNPARTTASLRTLQITKRECRAPVSPLRASRQAKPLHLNGTSPTTMDSSLVVSGATTTIEAAPFSAVSFAQEFADLFGSRRRHLCFRSAFAVTFFWLLQWLR